MQSTAVEGSQHHRNHQGCPASATMQDTKEGHSPGRSCLGEKAGQYLQRWANSFSYSCHQLLTNFLVKPVANLPTKASYWYLPGRPLLTLRVSLCPQGKEMGQAAPCGGICGTCYIILT